MWQSDFAERLRSRLFLALILIACPALSIAQSAPPDSPDPLLGMWGSEFRAATPTQGELTLDGRGGEWCVSIAGYEFPVAPPVQPPDRPNDATFDFAIPGENGEFRGSLDSKANVIRGFWIQPQTVIADRQYSTPLELHSIAPSVWRGNVAPLDLSISVYARIFVAPDGGLKAFFVNPEANFFHSRVFTLKREGSSLHLDANGWKLEGTYDEKSDAFSIRFVDFLPPFHFSRRTEKDAVGFYPRTPHDTGWQYRAPVSGADGWPTSSLGAEGLDEKPIAALVHKILAADPVTDPLQIQSLLIARHGHLVLEEYFYGFDQSRVHDMRSASKTFAPVLVGLAKDRGANLTPETRIYPLFSQYKSFANPDPRKEQITLRDIMTMTAGNACDDNDDQSPGNEDRMQGDAHTQDWYKYALDLPMLKSPGGEDAIYCSADLNLVGGVVAAVVHRALAEFFEQNLARPLQFGRYYLNLMPDGQPYMGGGAYIRPRDQLKLGQLYLDGGTWNGKRIISKSWVADSTSVHSRFDPSTSLGQEHQYGYGWHIYTLKSGSTSYRAFAAGGNGGQLVIVVPDLDLVVGITGGAYGEFKRWYRWESELVPQFILPAAK